MSLGTLGPIHTVPPEQARGLPLPHWKYIAREPEGIARLDIAFVQLVTNAGLPGSERLNPHGCLHTLRSWARAGAPKLPRKQPVFSGNCTHRLCFLEKTQCRTRKSLEKPLILVRRPWVAGSQATPDIGLYKSSTMATLRIHVHILALVYAAQEEGLGKNKTATILDLTKYKLNNSVQVPVILDRRIDNMYADMDSQCVNSLGYTDASWTQLLKDNLQRTQTALQPPKGGKNLPFSDKDVNFYLWTDKMIASLLVNELLHFYDVTDDDGDGIVLNDNLLLEFGANSPKRLFDFGLAILPDNAFSEAAIASRVSLMHAFYFGKFTIKK